MVSHLLLNCLKNDIISHSINTYMKVLLCFSGMRDKIHLLNISSVGKYCTSGLDSMLFGYVAKYKLGFRNEMLFKKQAS